MNNQAEQGAVAADPATRPQIGFGARVHKSPYFESTRRWGCKAYSVYNHMYMPLYYESPEADFWRLVEHVTLWDVGVERQVQISGPDAHRFVQYLTPRNLSNIAVGQCKYVLLTDENGGLVNDPVLLRIAEDRFWLSISDSDVLLWAKGASLGAGFDVKIDMPDVAPLQVQGPKSWPLMRDLFGEWIDDLKYFWSREAELNGIPVVISRTGWSGERGYEIYLLDSSRGDDLWEAIMAAGARYDIGPAAPSTIRRIEAGMLSYGGDAGLSENPFELGFDRLVDLEQEADFIGKEALKRIKAAGITRKMVGLILGGDPLSSSNEHPLEVRTSDGETVGRLPTCVYSPRLEQNIGMAIVALASSETGTPLTVVTPDGERPAEVAPLPFHDPKKKLASG